jgi:hypothetical protein
MNPTDRLTHSLRKATRWLTAVMCCLPLLAGADESKPNPEALRRGAKATAETKQRLATTIIPRVSFKDATIDEVIAVLRKELLGPDRAYPAAVYPVQFTARRSYGFQPKTVTLELTDVGAATAIEKIADLAGMTANVDLTLVTFWPKPDALAKAKAAADEAAIGKLPDEDKADKEFSDPSTGNKP